MATQQTENTTHATPTAQRAVTSYVARHLYHPGVVYPPHVPNVQDAIDIHVHCQGGQQDPLSLAKLASESGMLGLLYKTLVVPGAREPAAAIAIIREQLVRWADDADVKPIHCWAGVTIGSSAGVEQPLEYLRGQLDAGLRAVWLPNNAHANSYFKVGMRESRLDPKKHGHTAPMPWDEALKYGLYMLDDRGKLKEYYAEAIRMVADADVALFFGHATHQEIAVVAEFLDSLGFRRGVIDHPFSPFLDVSIEMMHELAKVGIRFNFTYDELSPLLGIDPFEMQAAIAAVGAEHFTLSSDCGEPLFPNSVEGMRQIRGYMEAFGCNAEELKMMCTTNPADIVGLSRN
jgi:hypothetical protein